MGSAVSFSYPTLSIPNKPVTLVDTEGKTLVKEEGSSKLRFQNPPFELNSSEWTVAPTGDYGGGVTFYLSGMKCYLNLNSDGEFFAGDDSCQSFFIKLNMLNTAANSFSIGTINVNKFLGNTNDTPVVVNCEEFFTLQQDRELYKLEIRPVYDYTSESSALLRETVQKGETDVLRALLETIPRGFKVLTDVDADGLDPFMLAILTHMRLQGSDPTLSLNLKKCIDMLLEAGAHTNNVTVEGYTIGHLFLKYYRNEPNTLGKILDNGTDISTRSEDGSTLVHIATSKNDLLCLSLLLERGADKNAIDKEGQTPVLIAFLLEDCPLDCLSLLLEKGADPNCTDQEGNRPDLPV